MQSRAPWNWDGKETASLEYSSNWGCRLCDWNYCDWRIGENECVAQEFCDVAACPPPPVLRTTEKMQFDVKDDITKDEDCALLDTIRTKYGFPATAKIKLDVGEFDTSVCE